MIGSFCDIHHCIWQSPTVAYTTVYHSLPLRYILLYMAVSYCDKHHCMPQSPTAIFIMLHMTVPYCDIWNHIWQYSAVIYTTEYDTESRLPWYKQLMLYILLCFASLYMTISYYDIYYCIWVYYCNIYYCAWQSPPVICISLYTSSTVIYTTGSYCEIYHCKWESLSGIYITV